MPLYLGIAAAISAHDHHPLYERVCIFIGKLAVLFFK